VAATHTQASEHNKKATNVKLLTRHHPQLQNRLQNGNATRCMSTCPALLSHRQLSATNTSVNYNVSVCMCRFYQIQSIKYVANRTNLFPITNKLPFWQINFNFILQCVHKNFIKNKNTINTLRERQLKHLHLLPQLSIDTEFDILKHNTRHAGSVCSANKPTKFTSCKLCNSILTV